MANQAGAPSPVAPEKTPLGRVALGLGIASLCCGVVAGLCVMVPSTGWLLGVVCVILAIAGIAVAIVAIVKQRARRPAIIGLVLSVLAAPVASLTAFIAVMVVLMSSYGISG